MIDQSKIHSVQCFPLTALEMPEWMFEAISDKAPFDWGQNNYSLVKPGDLADHLSDVKGRQRHHSDIEEFEQIINELRAFAVDHPNVYIDMEN